MRGVLPDMQTGATMTSPSISVQSPRASASSKCYAASVSLEPARSSGCSADEQRKSTLVKILSGYEQATEGDFTINGMPHRFANSREAERGRALS